MVSGKDSTPDPHIDGILKAALTEDLGTVGDITSDATVPEGAETTGRIVARAGGCIAGLGPALRVFSLLDDSIATRALESDGTMVDAGTDLATITGPARTILAGERVALNLLGRLCGIATATRKFVDRVAGTNATIVDTRKTTPLLRTLEKMAVRAGGGANHRMGLYDALLIKDNHIRAVGSAQDAVLRARQYAGADRSLEVEIDDLADLEGVIEAGADIVLLDNMPPTLIRIAVTQAAGRCTLEASGGITLESVREVAETGVDSISVGCITHSVSSLDVALDFKVPRSVLRARRTHD